MNLESGINLGTLLLTAIGIVAAGAVTWGGMMQRIKALEKEVAALSGFASTLAVMQSEILHIKDGINQITSSWLFREPPGYTSINPDAPPARRRP